MDEFDDIRTAIGKVPWDLLAHAYHRSSEAPGLLSRFVDAASGEADLAGATDWLFGSILHQGSIYSASIPTVWLLCELLGVAPNHPAGPEIIEAVRVIADAVSWAHDAPEDNEAPARRSQPTEPLFEAWVSAVTGRNGLDDDEYFKAAAVRYGLAVELLDHVQPVVIASLSNTDPGVRLAAVGAAVSCYAAVSGLRTGLQQLRHLIGASSHDPGSWLSIGMTVARADDEPDWLAHPDRRLRLAGALDPACAADPRSVAVLVESLGNLDWVAATYENGLPHLDFHARFHFLNALLERTTAEAATDVTADALVGVLRQTNKHVVDQEWGPILRWAFVDRAVEPPFPDKLEQPPVALTRVQRIVLEALVDNTALWDPRWGNAALWFKRVQLPYERKAIRRLLRSTERG